jgi:hypothetical protein
MRLGVQIYEVWSRSWLDSWNKKWEIWNRKLHSFRVVAYKICTFPAELPVFRIFWNFRVVFSYNFSRTNVTVVGQFLLLEKWKTHEEIQEIWGFILRSVRRGSSVSIVTGCRLGDRGSFSDVSGGLFLYPLRPDRLLGPTQPPVQWVPRIFPGGNCGRDVLNHSPPSSALG